MELVPFEDLDEDAFDAVVAATEDIDPFCSASPWVMSAHEGLLPDRTAFALKTQGGLLTLAESVHPIWGPYLEPIEAMWAYGSSMIGEDFEALASALVQHLRDRTDLKLVLVSGLEEGAPRTRAVARRLQPAGRIVSARTTRRILADLSQGHESWLAERSKNLRRTLHRAERDCREGGITFERIADPEDVEAVWRRIQAVERRSWKGLDSRGISAGSMFHFYHRMIPRLVRHGALRLVFAMTDGVDLAYHLGARWGPLYRGLQHSYDHRWRQQGLGAHTHHEMVKWMCETDAERYDLGQDIPYKARWADDAWDTVTLGIVRGR